MNLSDLRPFQARALAQVKSRIAAGSRAVVLTSPTGSGKTCMGSALAFEHVRDGGTVAWFAHRTELIDQAIVALRSFGLEAGRLGSRVPVLSIQAALAAGDVPEASMRIHDEVHHVAAPEWGRIPAAYGKQGLDIGLTATPERADGIGLSHFDALVVAAQVRELIDLGHLVPCNMLSPRGVLRSTQIAMTPAHAFERYAPERRAVVFSPNMKQAEEHLHGFLERGISARLVHGKMMGDHRRQALADFKRGVARVLVNIHCLVEGLDVPACDCVILAANMATQGRYLQAAGRGLRPSPGKVDCLILDLVGACDEHGRPDEDQKYSLDGLGIQPADAMPLLPVCRVCSAPLEKPGAPCTVCGAKPKETALQRVMGFELGAFEGATRRTPPDERAEMLAKWYAEGRIKGHKGDGRAHFVYKARFGGWPTTKTRIDAMRAMPAWRERLEREAVEAQRRSFYKWLIAQAARKDAIGELARGVKRDKKWPARRGYDGLVEYMTQRGETSEGLALLHYAWQGWEAFR